jgi:enoyl-CoA hydratase/carnithine racemase
MQQVMAQPQIVIAKVEGVATAAGCELVAACDLALASEAARFAVPGVNIGFWCHTPQVLLERAVGRKHAMMMLATGSLFPADHALRIGLVNAVHRVDELDAATEELARTIAAKPASVLRAGKASFHRQSRLPLAEAYAFVQGEALRNIVHPDAIEGISAFLEKRPPNW